MGKDKGVANVWRGSGRTWDGGGAQLAFGIEMTEKLRWDRVNPPKQAEDRHQTTRDLQMSGQLAAAALNR